jgi:NADPH:quinone reductase-like Zn-dependent oxidoreductase
MRAAVFDRYGPPEVVHVVDLPDPEPGPGQVRVRVRAAGVQPFDGGVRRGEMTFVPVQFPQTIGQEYSGVIDRLGPGVEGVEVGAAVLGSTMMNGQASLVAVPVENVVGKPPELQLATLAGATVVGTASPANHAYLRQLGAIPVAYGDGLVDAVRATGVTPTVALDAAGGAAIGQSVRLGIAPDRIGTIVDDKSAAQFGARVVRAGRSPARLAEVIALAARGIVTMPVRAYPLAEVVAAHAAVESRHGRGKVVLIVEE